MTFKLNWEKAHTQHKISDQVIEAMVAQAYPSEILLRYEVIAGGCANLNVKFQLKEVEDPLLLRVYLRDKTAAKREKKLAGLLKHTLPVPNIYYVEKYKEYVFSIVEFMPGIPLSKLLTSDRPHDIEQIMTSVGQLLAKISEKQFDTSGFFDADLNIIETINKESFLSFAKQCLESKLVLSQLGVELVEKVDFYLDKFASYFPDASDRNLVHADFDPANILVEYVDKHWEISAALDWEFSFSSSILVYRSRYI